MKPFDSAEANLPTPTKLDFKIMKETVDDVSTEDQRLSETQTSEVQNGSKKLLESVDLNTSSITVSENSVKKDSARTSPGSDSEKENEVTVNGFPEVTATNEADSLLSKSKNNDQGGIASPKIGIDGISDCSSEENTGIRTTVEVSGTSISDCEEEKVNSVMPDGSLDDVEGKEALPLSNGDLKHVSEEAEERVSFDEAMDTKVLDDLQLVSKEVEERDTLAEPMDTAVLDVAENALGEALDIEKTDSFDGTKADEFGLLEGESDSLGVATADEEKPPFVDEVMDIDVGENELMASSGEIAEQSCDEEMESDLLEAPGLQSSANISSDTGVPETGHLESSDTSGVNTDSACNTLSEAEQLEPSSKSGENNDSASFDVLPEAEQLEPSSKSEENKDSVSCDALAKAEQSEPSNKSEENKDSVSCDALSEAEQLEPSNKSRDDKGSVSCDALSEAEQLEPSNKSREDKDSVSCNALSEDEKLEPSNKSREDKDSVSCDALPEAEQLEPSNKSGETKGPKTSADSEHLNIAYLSGETEGPVSSDALSESKPLETFDKLEESEAPVSSGVLLGDEELESSDKSEETKDSVTSNVLPAVEQLESSFKSGDIMGPISADVSKVEYSDKSGETKDSVSSDVEQLEPPDKSAENKGPVSSDVFSDAEQLEPSGKPEETKSLVSSDILSRAEQLEYSGKSDGAERLKHSDKSEETECGNIQVAESEKQSSSDLMKAAEQVLDLVSSPSKLLGDESPVSLMKDKELQLSEASARDINETDSNSLVESEVSSDVAKAAKIVAPVNLPDSSKVLSSDKAKEEFNEPEPAKQQVDGEHSVSKEIADELMEDAELDAVENGVTKVVNEPLVDTTDKLLESIDSAIGMDASESQSSAKAPITNGIDLSEDHAETITQSSDKPTDADVTSCEELMKVAKEAYKNGVAREDSSSSEKSVYRNGRSADPLVKCSRVIENSVSDLNGREKKKRSEKQLEKLKVSYSQIKSNSLSTAASSILTDMDISDFDSGTAVDSLHTTNLRDDIEDDLRAMEDSMWSDDINKSKEKFVTKISSEDKSIPVVPHGNVPEEERLNRKRTSEGCAEDITKRAKVSADNELDSDVGSETSKRHQEDDAERKPKKVRTMDEEREEEEEKGSSVYRSNLDKIIDQVASGVLNGEGEETMDGSIIDDDLQEVTTLDSDKDSTDTSKSKPMPFVRKLHAEELKKISKNDLEELVVQKICEVVTERSEVGELRQRTAFLEQLVENWRKKAHSLSKQVRDMEMVMKRFVNDQKSKKDRIVLPVKITRSVGLQVHLGQPNNQVGFSRPRPAIETTRPPMRRRSEKPASSQTPSSTPSTPKVPTSTASSTTPPKIPATPPPPPPSTKTPVNTSTSNSPTLPSAPVVKTVAVTPTTKTVSTPAKTNLSRPIATSTSASTNLTARLASTTVTPRVSKPMYATATATPIAPKPNQDLIDLTDEEDRSKSNTLRNALTVTSADALIPTSVTSVLPSTAITTAGVGRGIRVVQQHQLTANTTTTAAILTPTGTDGGQRLAYLVPTSTMSSQQRQLVLTPQQVRAGGVMSVPGRPTILFKSGPVVSMPQGALPPGTVVQTGVASSSSALLRPNPALATVAPQQRSAPLRLPGTMASLGRMATTVNAIVTNQPTAAIHPAPLPSLPPYAPTSLNLKLAPPKPELKISKVSTRNAQGIVLSWNMTLSSEHEEVASYQLYAYQEGTASPSTSLWKKVGDVKALPLPMACTLTQFQEGHKYHFAVRAVDVHMRCGQFSAPGNIMLTRK